MLSGIGYRDVAKPRDRLGSNASKSSMTKSTMSTSKSSSSKVCKKSEFEYVSFTHSKNDELIFKGSTIESRISDGGHSDRTGSMLSGQWQSGYVHSIPLTPSEPGPNHTVIQLRRKEEEEQNGSRTGSGDYGTGHSGKSGTSSGQRPVPKTRTSKVPRTERATLEMIKEKVVSLPGVIYTNGT